MTYEGKTVLVTGGTGFVGTRLAERLCLEERAHVRVLVHNWTSAVWVSRSPVELVEGDVCDRDSVCDAMRGCEVVFHCATGGNTRQEQFDVNVEGTRNVFECALAEGVQRVVHVSSIAVHGPTPPDGADETAPLLTTGKAYSDSKIEAERLASEYHREHGLPVTVVRPTFIWGPRGVNFTVRPIRDMKAGRFVLVDEGAGACHAVHVDNLVDAMLLAGTTAEAVGEAFLVTDGVDLTWAEFFGHYARLLGIEKLPSRGSDSAVERFAARSVDVLDSLLVRLSPNPAPLWRKVIRRSARIVLDGLYRRGTYNAWHLAKFGRRGGLCIDKARRVLGYAPRVSLSEGMREIEAWVRDQMGFELGMAAANDARGLAGANDHT